jgi:hypothetical protein
MLTSTLRTLLCRSSDGRVRREAAEPLISWHRGETHVLASKAQTTLHQPPQGPWSTLWPSVAARALLTTNKPGSFSQTSQRCCSYLYLPLQPANLHASRQVASSLLASFAIFRWLPYVPQGPPLMLASGGQAGFSRRTSTIM